MKIRPSRTVRTLCLAIGLGATACVAGAAEQDSVGGPLPAQELAPQTIYQFLLAEIAGARGQISLSAQIYLELARATRDPRIARRATEIAMFSRNPQMAGEAARLWMETAPQSEEARRVFAGVGGGGGTSNLEQVQLQLARALAQSNGRIGQNLLGLNRALAGIPDKDAVLRIVQRLTEPYLDVPEAHLARAHAAMVAEDPMQGLGAVDAALRLKPSWEPAVQLKAQILVHSGASAEAVRQLEVELERNPDSAPLRLALARALVSAQRFEQARDQFNQLLAAKPDDAELLYAVGLLSMQLKDEKTAESHYLRALEAGYPQPDLIRLQLGQMAERRGEGTLARKWFGEVSDAAHRPEAMILTAQSMAREGQVDEACALLKAQGGSAEARRSYLLAEAQVLREADRSAAALDVLDEALRATPDDSDLLYESAMLAERLNRVELMESRLRRVIELKPEHAHAHNALGYSLADRGLRLDEAEALIARALELSPDDPFILDSMGWVRFRRGDAATALTHLERAYGIRPDAEIAAHLGEVLWSMERREDANRIFDEGLKAHPSNTLLTDTVRRLRGQ
ncbi:MAG TPA: tetratricopeptide repeat protein [Thauera sp.]|nr:tetratricopeptide repeat protein [Thauera sp.]